MKKRNPIATVDGRATDLDATPILSSGRTMVPLRFVKDHLGLGGPVAYDDETQVVTVNPY